MAQATAIAFELRYRKEARHKVNGKMVRNDDRFTNLPDEPAQFSAMKGKYSTVSAVATRLNESQLRSGFLDYLFFPEVSTAPHGTDDLDD